MVPPTPRPASHCHNGSGGDCAITSHPTLKSSTYCTTHQTICLLCPANPRHSIGKKCKDCVFRIRAETRAKDKAKKEERAAAREAVLEAAEARLEAGRRAGEGKAKAKSAKKARKGGKKKRKREQVIEEC